MANNNTRGSIFVDRKSNYPRVRQCDNYHPNCRNDTNKRINICLWAIVLLITPLKTVANTTVASPSSNSTGVVNNNATQIIPGSWPTNRYSQGIQCTSPTITFSPYLVKTHSYGRPKSGITRTPIYDEDTGEVKYYSEIPRFEKDNFSRNFGASLQFNIPLGKGIDLCHQAVKTNIKNQELLYKKSALEVSLHRLKICAEQLKLGVRFRPGSASAITCDDIEVTVKPGQVLPHVHQTPTSSFSLKSESQQSIPFASLFSEQQKAPQFYVPEFSLSD